MRVLRRFVILLSCLAAALAVGVGALHIRSMSTADQLTSVRVLEDGRPALLRGYKVRSYRGHLFFSKIECDDDSGIYSRDDLGWRFRSERDPLITLPGRRQNGIERLGFIFGSEGGPPVNPWRQTYAFVPHWAVTALLVLTATPLWFQASRALRARRRIAAGKCVSCGYDLRANTGVCPECGAALRAVPP